MCVCVCVCGWGVEERGGNRDESLLVQEVEVVLFGCLEGLKCPAEELVVLLVHSEMEQHPGLHPLSWATFVSFTGSAQHTTYTVIDAPNNVATVLEHSFPPGNLQPILACYLHTC